MDNGYNNAAEKAYFPYARLLIYLNLKDDALILLENMREKAERRYQGR